MSSQSLQFIDLGTGPNTGTGDSILSAFTKINDNFALINTLTNFQSYTDVTNLITQIEQNYNNIQQQVSSKASITDVYTVVANSTGSLAQEVKTLQAQFLTLNTSTGASISYVDTAVANSTGSIAQSINTLTAYYNNLSQQISNRATITYVNTAIANSFTSIATEVNTLQASFNNLSTSTGATISYVNQAVANSTSSLALEINQLSATYTNLVSQISSKADISYVNSAIASSTASIATEINTLQTSFNNLSTSTGATVSYVNQAVSNSTQSLATAVSTLQTNYSNLSSTVNNKANITDVQTAISNSTQSLASSVSTLQTNYSNLSSSISSKADISYVDTAVSNSTGSLASSISTLQSSYNGLSSSVTTYSSAINGLEANWGVTVDSNGSVAGIKLNSSPSGSSFVVSADQFKIYTSGGALNPFSVSGSTVTMQNVVVSGTVQVGSTPALSGTSMTGSGAVINSDGTFALGTSAANITFNGTKLAINGLGTIAKMSQNGVNILAANTYYTLVSPTLKAGLCQINGATAYLAQIDTGGSNPASVYVDYWIQIIDSSNNVLNTFSSGIRFPCYLQGSSNSSIAQSVWDPYIADIIIPADGTYHLQVKIYADAYYTYEQYFDASGNLMTINDIGSGSQPRFMSKRFLGYYNFYQPGVQS